MNKQTKMFLIALALTGTLTFTSCGKYEDGPGFSLRSKTARLTNGSWEVEEIDGDNLNGVALIFEFEKDGVLKIHSESSFYSYYYTFCEEAEWAWGDKKETLEIEYENTEDSWEIKRLTFDEFWFEDEYNTDYKCDKQ